jgi:hypothetical protein
MNLNTYAIIRWRNLSKTQGRMSSKKPFYFQASEITDKKYLDSKVSNSLTMSNRGTDKPIRLGILTYRTKRCPSILKKG